MKKRLTVFLDGEEHVRPAGMKVRHLLTGEQVALVNHGTMAIVDSHGYERGLDGALSDGLKLHLRPGRDPGR